MNSVETERKPQHRNSFTVTYITTRHKHPLSALIIHTYFLVIGLCLHPPALAVKLRLR